MSTDPAVEAAERAQARDGHAVDREQRVPITAAREVLAPIHELIEAHAEYHQPRAERGVLHSQGVMHLIRDLTPLLYAEEELREEPAPDRLRGHPAIPVPTSVPEQTARRFAGPTITPEETP